MTRYHKQKYAKVIMGLGLCLGVSAPAMAWESRSFGSPHPINALKFATVDTGYAVGDSGTVLKTSNGGLSWTSQAIGTFENLSSIHILDARTAWIVGGPPPASILTGHPATAFNEGGSLLYRTTNGGQNWQLMSHDSSFSFNSFHFTDADSGWVSSIDVVDSLAPRARVLRTTNGGATWDVKVQSFGVGIGGALATPPNVSHLLYFSPLNSAIFAFRYVTSYYSQGTHMEVLDVRCSLWNKPIGSDTWLQGTCDNNLGSSLPASVRFIRGDSAWVGSLGTVKRSSNGGITWTNSNEYQTSIKSIHFDGNLGYAVGTNGVILRTSNAGENWTQQVVGTQDTLTHIQILSQTVAYALSGRDSLLKGDPSVDLPVVIRKYARPGVEGRLVLRNNNLNYHLSHPSYVTIKLLDAKGSTIKTIQQGLQVAGIHQISLPENGFPPGNYLLDFKAGKVHETLMIQGL